VASVSLSITVARDRGLQPGEHHGRFVRARCRRHRASREHGQYPQPQADLPCAGEVRRLHPNDQNYGPVELQGAVMRAHDSVNFQNRSTADTPTSA
jgi:hypothetical protein